MGVLTAIKNLFEDEFSPVYELQNEVLRRGGEIDRNSDLVVAFERRSLVPSHSPRNALIQLVQTNRTDRFKDLFSVQFLCYEKTVSIFGNTFSWKPIRKDIGEKIGPNQSYLSGEEQEKARCRLVLKDSELLDVNKASGLDSIISLNPKYIGILRLVNNNIFIPNTYRMKRRNSVIIGISIIIASLILGYAYAYANRYYVERFVIIDKWKGEYIKVKDAKPN